MSKSNRPPNRKRKVLLFILIALILLNVYYKSPLTYVKEKKIINYAMLRHRIDFVLESIQIDAGNKKISYKLYTRFSAEPEQFGKIRCRFNEYLKNIQIILLMMAILLNCSLLVIHREDL